MLFPEPWLRSEEVSAAEPTQQTGALHPLQLKPVCPEEILQSDMDTAGKSKHAKEKKKR